MPKEVMPIIIGAIILCLALLVSGLGIKTFYLDASSLNGSTLNINMTGSGAGVGDCPSGYVVQNTTTGGVECVSIPVSSTPSLQEVTDVGSVTTNTITAPKFKGNATQLFFGKAGGSSNAWTVSIPGITEYSDNMMVVISPSYISNSVTTLDINGLGAKKVYYHTSSASGYYAAGATYLFVYDSTKNGGNGAFTGLHSYNSDTNSYILRFVSNIKAETAITAYNIITGTRDGYNHLKSGATFDVTLPILWALSNIGAGSTGSNNYIYYYFTITTTQSITLTPYAPVYIKGELEGIEFTPVNTAPLTQTEPTTEDGYDYFLLGYAYSTTAMYIYPSHEIYRYANGEFRLSPDSTVARIGDCPSGQVVMNITTNGVECVTVSGGGGGTPAGSDGQIQFNDGGSFGADSHLRWDDTNKILTVGNKSNSGGGIEVTGDNIYSAYAPYYAGLDNSYFKYSPYEAQTEGGLNTQVSGLGATAFGFNDDLTNLPYYAVEAKGASTFSVHGKALKDYAMAIGSTTYSSGTGSLAMGGSFSGGAYASGTNAIAISTGSKAYGDFSIAIGHNAISNGERSMALGYGAESEDGVAIGHNAESKNGVAIGYESYTGFYQSPVAIGTHSRADGTFSLAIGYKSEARTNFSTAIGFGAVASAINSGTIAISDSGYQKVTNNKSNSILFGIGYRTENKTQSLLELEFDKGVRIGATSGESITMSGDDLYVKGNQETDGFLVLGSNTQAGLSAGDINASNIYYDALVAKSPIIQCSNINCKVTVPELQQEFWVTRDENWNVISSDKTLPKVVTEKFKRLHDKKIDDDAKIECLAQGDFWHYKNSICTFSEKEQCESSGYSIWDGKDCLDNPYMKCENGATTSFNFDKDTCEYNAEKDCANQRGFYDRIQSSCIMPTPQPKTKEENIKDCVSDKNKMWDGTSCISLKLYITTKKALK